MIEGHATPEKTLGFVGQRLPGAHGLMGTTGLTVSHAGFGGYRVSSDVATHQQALEHALASGVNLIDTSTNYTDGGSETLVGRVLAEATGSGRLDRRAVVVVSKAGYLQGSNFTLSQERSRRGDPFPDIVPYGQGLEHCIHPEFIEDQLDRSLDRLQLRTLDVFLLHNPEYYLDWAEKSGMAPQDARGTYYRRLEKAFVHLESEADRGRIRWYGISSNTFPSPADAPDATCLDTVWDIARSLGPSHRFRVIQMPFNALESGAVLEPNQPDGGSVLAFARENDIGVLINRPLNAFAGDHMLRLADIRETETKPENEIIRCIRALGQSETRLWRQLLPRLDVPGGLRIRVKQQVAVSDGLKQYWRNFGSYERWRQARDANFQPRVQGVIDFLAVHGEAVPELAQWIEDHRRHLTAACDAVGSIYGESAAVRLRQVRRAMAEADPDWRPAGSLSQQAIDAIRSTAGISCVLVGMRTKAYVDDVLEALTRTVVQKERTPSWERLRRSTREAFGTARTNGR